MNPRSAHTHNDSFGLKLAITGYSAVVTTVLLLAIFVTPAQRGGGPLLWHLVEPIAEQFNLSENQLKGENPMVNLDPSLRIKPRFVVRFEDSSDVLQSLRRFREDQTEGQAAFSDWAEQSDAFKGFKLRAVTLAGDAIVAYDTEIMTMDPDATLRNISIEMQKTPGVRLADPFPFYPRSEDLGLRR